MKLILFRSFNKKMLCERNINKIISFDSTRTRRDVCFLFSFVTKYQHISSIYEQPSLGSLANSLLIHVDRTSRAKHRNNRDLCEHIACKWLQVCGQSVYLHRSWRRPNPGEEELPRRCHNIAHTLSLGHERKRARHGRTHDPRPDAPFRSLAGNWKRRASRRHALGARTTPDRNRFNPLAERLSLAGIYCPPQDISTLSVDLIDLRSYNITYL